MKNLIYLGAALLLLYLGVSGKGSEIWNSIVGEVNSVVNQPQQQQTEGWASSFYIDW